MDKPHISKLGRKGGDKGTQRGRIGRHLQHEFKKKMDEWKRARKNTEEDYV